MKSKLMIILGCICVLLLIIVFCAATDKSSIESNEPTQKLWNQFVIVDKEYSLFGTLYTVYDKDSKAMYYYTTSRFDGGLSPIYNADGTVKYYKG